MKNNQNISNSPTARRDEGTPSLKGIAKALDQATENLGPIRQEDRCERFHGLKQTVADFPKPHSTHIAATG